MGKCSHKCKCTILQFRFNIPVHGCIFFRVDMVGNGFGVVVCPDAFLVDLKDKVGREAQDRRQNK